MMELERCGGLGGESSDRLQAIINTLNSEKEMLAKRLAKANRDKFDRPVSSFHDERDDSDQSYRENYIYMREPGLLFSS